YCGCESGTVCFVLCGGKESGSNGKARPFSAATVLGGCDLHRCAGGDLGGISGTYSLDLIHASHPARGADVIATLAWTSQPNQFGIAGTHTITSSRNGPINTGASGHGGLNPWVVHNTFIAWGRDFRKNVRIENPVSFADVMPTVLTLLGTDVMNKDKN